ncbi:hypothetical protein CMQ_4630 [Grosmannia clavigera kw1407]|uniref:Uncharacterized protein n=1 Tax=Grosmannia clavigera (strain kw1407 / UAMH 11150) TaxID=655863 RepID=F0XUV8_GROCL|nr:uncharacterized protein CMQ_4630 [Grosmannia clavigera kw1407]EFW98778.1 hypothetical protein CMQ_4630 [Grosmannia clavigera kw1407]
MWSFDLAYRQPTDYTRTQVRTATDKPKNNDVSLPLDAANRRPAGDRHNQRNASGKSSACGMLPAAACCLGPDPSMLIGGLGSEEIVLGPPKLGFASTSLRTAGIKLAGDLDRASRDADTRDRFGVRGRNDASDASNFNNGSGGYGNGNGDRTRDGRNNRRRGDADQDGEGWSTVKPRKSFGHEGAERFHGRMGGGGSGVSGGGIERFGRDGKPRERDDGDVGGRDRPRRTFDRDVTRDRDGGDENDGPRRNGVLGGRGPWFKDSNGGSTEERPERTDRTDRTDRTERNSQRERIDRTKNWRERDPDLQPMDNYREKNNHNERGGGNGHDRRWDRDRDRDHYQHRVEREPEWLDEPAPLGKTR